MTSYIGWWGFRLGTGRAWHRVESEVTDRLVMKCGRQMKFATGGRHMVFEQFAGGPECRQCLALVSE